MTEHIGEASILIRPDVTKFREQLIADLTAATKGVTVAIPTGAAGGGVAKVTAANKELTASTKQAGAAAAVLSAEEQRLAQAASLAATAQEKLAAVSKADALSTTELAGAKARLRAANLAVAAATKANEAALATENAELKANVAATLQSAQAEAAAAEAAALEGVAHAKASSEIAAHAAAEHSLVSGARAAGVSLTGLRGATLATSGAFLAGAVSVKLLEESIHEASTEAAAAARTTQVFGDEAHHLEEEAKGLADTLGVSAAQALNFESKLGNLLVTAGFTTKQAAQLSDELLKTGANIAAFQNVKVDKVLQAIQLGLVGNSRGLRQFQIELNQARVNAVALRESGKESVKQLTQEDKIRARVSETLRQAARQQGAAANNAEQLAQKEKVARAELANLGGTIGRIAIPKVTELLTEVNLLVKGLTKLGDATESAASKVGGSQFGHFVKDVQTLFSPTPNIAGKIGVLKELKNLVFPKDVNRDFKDLNFQGEKFSGTMTELHQKALDLWHQKAIDDFNAGILQAISSAEKLAAKAAQVSFENAIRSVDRLDEKITDLKISGVSDAGLLPTLAQQEAAARAAVAAATARANITVGSAGHDTAIKQRREAKDRLLGIVQQERDINKQISDDAIQAAKDIQKAIEDAQQKVKELIDQANQDLLETIDVLGRPFEIRQLRVSATESLQDDLAFQQDLQVNIKKQLVLATQIVGDAKLRAQTIHTLMLALVQAEIDEKNLRKEIAKNAQDRKAARRQFQENALDLNIEYAQITKNVKLEIRAHQAKIKFINAQLKHTKEGTNEWRKLRNEKAAEQAAIKELLKQTDKTKEDFKALQFEFLQTESGFVENLLSNILPTATIAGTVGGGSFRTSSAPSGGGGGGTIDTLPTDFGGGTTGAGGTKTQVAGDSATAATTRGASSGQMSTLIHVNRQMLLVLRALAGHRAAPEAAVQKTAQHVVMDTIGW